MQHRRICTAPYQKALTATTPRNTSSQLLEKLLHIHGHQKKERDPKHPQFTGKNTINPQRPTTFHASDPHSNNDSPFHRKLSAANSTSLATRV